MSEIKRVPEMRARALSQAFWALAAVTVLLLGLLAGCGNRSVEQDLPAVKAANALTAAADREASSIQSLNNEAAGAEPSVLAESKAGEPAWTPNAAVERVVDGDTIVVRVGDRSEPVRLIGIDTPESVARTRPVQCYGPEASQFLKTLLPEGTQITLLRDEEARDIYDRLLGYVVRSSDGLFVNLEIVAAGYAAVLTFPPNDHYVSAFTRAEREAVSEARGLWGACGGPDVPLE